MKQALKLIVALAALLAVVAAAQGLDLGRGLAGGEARDALDRTFEAPSEGLLESSMGLGLLLLGAWFAGRLFKAIKLPKISGFLLFGVLVGPSVLALVTKEQLPYLRLVNDLAIALIALTAGGQIHFQFVRSAGKIIFGVAGLQLLAILVAVGLATFFLLDAMNVSAGLDVPQRIALALIVATVATAGAPAVILAVVGEVGIGGLTPRLALSVTVVKDLVLIGLFAVVMAVGTPLLLDTDAPDASPDAGNPAQVESPAKEPGEPPAQQNAQDPGQTPDAADERDADRPTAPAPTAPTAAAGRGGSLAGGLTWLLGGSVLAGVLLGLGLAWYVHAVNAHLPAFVVMACFGIAFFSEAVGFQPLIVALVAGLLMVNVWKESSAGLFETVDDLSLPVYCVFFAVAGAKIDLAALAGVWQAALAVVFVRAAAVWVSTFLGVRFGDCDPSIRRWLWAAFIPQAGVSVLLAAIVQRTFTGEGFADAVYSLMLAAIALQEVVGPILFKIGLVRIDASTSEQGEPSAEEGGEGDASAPPPDSDR